MSALSWEANHPERLAWSDCARKIVAENLEALEQAKDIEKFCSSYGSMGKSKRVEFWCELIAAMAYYESSWKPAMHFGEPPPLGYDSIGLLQLSYEDRQYAKYGVLDRKKKSLEDPINNLTIGIRVLAYWVKRDACIANDSNKGGGRYWSVLRPKRKLPDVIKRVKANFKPT